MLRKQCLTFNHSNVRIIINKRLLSNEEFRNKMP